VNPVPVVALFDPEQADRAALRDLLDRFGYEHPEKARQEGREEGALAQIERLRASVVAKLRARGHPDAAVLAEGRDMDGLLALLDGP
jgi:hypothetical protein